MHNFKITYPRARLEGQLVVDPSFSRGFTLARYEHSQVNMRWWQRTITATDKQWLRLNGRYGTSPAETWNKILVARDRPILPLPVLVLTDFVAYATEQMQSDRWWLFHWVAWAIDELLRSGIVFQLSRDETTVVPEALEVATQALVDGLLGGISIVAWPTSDEAQLQTLIHLGELIWSFPPDLVRRLVDAFVLSIEQDLDLADAPGGQPDSRQFIGPGQLVQLSGVHLWRNGVPKVRQLPFHMSTTALPSLIKQALILTHPDAPLIDDADLARLCDGTIGRASDPPSRIQPAYNDAVNLPDFAPSVVRSRIATYAQATSTGSSAVPIGHWDVSTTSRFPLFRALDLHAVHVIVTLGGCWVRLLPKGGEWGKVLWWVPQIEPHPCLAFTFGVERKHPLVWALHETIWMLWRDIHIDGAPRLS